MSWAIELPLSVIRCSVPHVADCVDGERHPSTLRSLAKMAATLTPDVAGDLRPTGAAIFTLSTKTLPERRCWAGGEGDVRGK